MGGLLRITSCEQCRRSIYHHDVSEPLRWRCRRCQMPWLRRVIDRLQRRLIRRFIVRQSP